MKKACRIVLTGGPGGGKTTAADLYRREIGEGVVVVPEAATLLYLGGFPRAGAIDVIKITQKAIYNVQVTLEDAQAAHYKSRTLLCDRGTLDGAAYWPGPVDEFLSYMQTSIQNEYERYDAVIFFETAAVGGISIEGGNPIRTESLDQAIALNEKLKKIWSGHPGFVHISHENSFLKKVGNGLREISKIVGASCKT